MTSHGNYKTDDLTRFEEVNDLDVFTLAVWLACVAVGVLGLLLAYPQPHPPARAEQPIAERFEVELSRDMATPPDAVLPPGDPLEPPPPPEAMTLLPIAQRTAAVEASPAIAFPAPVEGPVRIVGAEQAERPRPATTKLSVAITPAPQPLTYGQGEGRQPEPEYPLRAVRQREEGTVVVRFAVNESGEVTSAEAFLPSPWPLLNEAAVRGVKDRWHFRTGPPRLYDVAIRFKL